MGAGAKVSSRGFTLLELLVVLLVLATAAALAAPAIGRSTDAVRVRAEVAGFAAMLRHAREQAIVTGRPHSVVVDPAAGQITIVAPAETTSEDQVLKRRSIPAGWGVDAPTPGALSVRFEPQGNSSGGDFRLVVGGFAYRVTVDPVTGRVRSARE